MGPNGDSNEDPSVDVLHETSVGDATLPEIQSLQPHADAFSKKLDKSKRQSKYASMGSDIDNPNFKRRTSKLGLFGLFNRSKISLDIETPQEKLETQWEGIVSTERPVTRDPGAAYVPPETNLTTLQGSSNMSMDAELRHQSSKSKLRNRQSFRRESKREFKDPIPLPPITWNAPPLFQVYPQSVKYSTLKAPVMSAEAVLRLNKERDVANEGSTALYGERSSSISEKPQKEKKTKKPTALDALAKGEWLEKIYVLVTAGYLLQYAGQGTYDRVPEKILRLTEMSVAFATDAIPGKPFVLQISQSLNEDGTVETDVSRSMFKKIGGLRADMRRTVSNLLLVLESPEEMNEWLVAVRKEIEALGGKEYNPEMPWDEPEDKAAKSKETVSISSQRYLVTRNQGHISPKSWEPPYDVSLNDKVNQMEKPQELLGSPTPSVGNRQSMATQNSTTSRYVSDTHASIDQVQLDRLRESYASTADMTASTSRESSPNRSPLFEHDSIPEIRPKPLPKGSAHSETGRMIRQRPAESKGADRESLQPTPTPFSRPSSMAGPSSERTMLPAPNFSVPSFSKRYSTASASPPPSAAAQSPPPITILQGSSVSEDEDDHYMIEEGGSSIGQLQNSYKSSPRTSMRLSSSQPSTSYLNSPPATSHVHVTPPGSSDGERPYSRRFSSLDYARGISPVKPKRHSPSPHPPPNVPLPPLPDSASSSKRTSLIPPPAAPPIVPLPTLAASGPSSQPPLAPPPTCALPPIPTDRRASSRGSTLSTHREGLTTPSQSAVPSPASSTSPFPPPAISLPSLPKESYPTTSSEKRQSNPERRLCKPDSSRTRLTKPRPSSAQSRDIIVTTPPPPQAAFLYAPTVDPQTTAQPPRSVSSSLPSTSAFALSTASPPSSSSSITSPPKPTRAAPPPPPPLPPTGGAALEAAPPPVLDVPSQRPSPGITESPIQVPPLPVSDAPWQAPPPLVSNSSFPSTLPILPAIQPRKSTPRIGREPPAIFSPRIFSRTKAAVVPSVPPPSIEVPTARAAKPAIAPSPKTDEQEEKQPTIKPSIVPSSSAPEPKKEQAATPHPFIPPIKLSHSREKGSFDGPWNADYGQSPKRTFLDFGAA